MYYSKENMMNKILLGTVVLAMLTGSALADGRHRGHGGYGGGGGSHNSGDFPGGFGGPGVIIVRY